MKWLFGFLLLFCLSFSLEGQKMSTQAFYKKYKPKEKVSEKRHIHWVEKLAPGLFLEKEETQKMLQDPSQLRIIVLPAKSVNQSALTGLRENVPDEDLALLLKAKDKSEWLDLFFEVEDNRAKNILYLLQDEDEFVFMTLKGDWSLMEVISKGKSL